MRSIPVVVLCTILSACTEAADRTAGHTAARDCATSAILALLNDSETTVMGLRDNGLHATAARNLVAARDDGTVFSTMDEVDAVSYVGPVAMSTLEDWGAAQCDAPACEEPAVVAFVNDAATTAVQLEAAGVYGRGADNIVSSREDGTVFSSLADIDRVPYVGDASIAALERWGAQRCAASAVFSPQRYADSHLAATESDIDDATARLDVAMYSFSDTTMLDAIERAVERGVTVRVIFHGAKDDRSDPEGTRSAQLEDLGIEVRYTNKTMHHKFVLIDGPREDAADAAGATLVTGSANWSYSAATRYDENTFTVRGDEKLVLLFQREFDHLWDHSRPVTWNEDISAPTHVGISDDDIADAEGSAALFTSANMRTYTSTRYGETFARDGDEWAVAEAIAARIGAAQRSVWVASGHLRSRLIAEAIMDLDSDIDVRVILDGQEYTSSWYYSSQATDYDDCVTAAGDEGDLADCDEQGLYFGYALHAAGVPLRYKYYAYRWDYSYALQMHHKYILIDQETLLTGSYNFSPNAEFDTLENVAVLSASRYPSIVADYEANFESMWDNGRDGSYADMLSELSEGTGDVDLVFSPMALRWDEIDVLKDAIQDACPDVDSDAYRADPDDYQSCPRGE